MNSGFQQAREAAQRALALAPDLPEAHAALGLVFESHDWDWKEADRHLQRALALAPGNADVLRAVASLAGILGRADESIELLRRAVALDPLSSTCRRFLGLRCAIYGRLDEADAALRASLDLNPKAGLVHCFLAITRLLTGNATEALDLAEREVLPDFRSMGMSMALHTLGRAAESEAALAKLIDDHGAAAGYQVAEVCVWRGEVSRAFEWLEKAYAARDPGLSHTATDPLLKPLHAEPRWRPFIQKMGLG
jgi:tetratricopeptide (TPR) repeat protein